MMNIIIVSIDEPIYTFQFWEPILDRFSKQIVKVYIYKDRKMNLQKRIYQTFYNLLLVLTLYDIKDIYKVLKTFLLSLINGKEFPLSLEYLCKKYNISPKHVNSVNSKEFREEIEQLSPDLVLAQVTALVKKDSLTIPRIGWINKHCGLLPDQKGVFPVLWTYWNGERKAGVTIHVMNEKFDEGEILRQEAIEVQSRDTIPDIYKALNVIASKLVLDYLQEPDRRQSLIIDNDRYFNKPPLKKLLKHLILR